MPNLSSLTFSFNPQLSWNAVVTNTGADYANSSPKSQGGINLPTISYASTTANAAVGGADEFISFVQTVNASSSVTIDLTALTDILKQSSVSLARVKFMMFRLLSAADDATNGTAASSITVGNNASNDFLGWLAGTTPTFSVSNGGCVLFSEPSAGGKTVDGTHKILKITNNDAGVAAKVQITIVGGTT